MQQSAKLLFISLVVLAAVTSSNAANISSSRSKFVTTTTPDPDEEFDQGDPFQYSYAVDAEPTVNETRVRQSKAESSDGQEVVGQYKVLLPDGRLQTVSYTSGPNGYKATVKYVQVGVDNPAVMVVSSSTESNGRSFTVSRTRTTSPTTTTTSTTTTTTTTSAPIIVQEPVDDRREKQRQQTEPIDSRTSSSSRSRQRSNRTRGGGERFRSPQETAAAALASAAAAVAGQTTGDLTIMMTAAGQTDDATRIDSTVSRFKSSPPSFGMKMSRRFDGKRTEDFN
ncbi:hypothetical protein DAPPUDRAFT_97750 [Daphnia pulex]|uniref:Cuticle protein n=1 Tax=Daphnia pulex TaxID=6669 RepID=E9G167_DAPPU|nr:hypothetical protein DAPPUDRAFT_97750 [Daphnia pulex]|eukprot:EFX86619.1 hypothetical protein DAPPUDRAFT_97750 [Daphnia pulex]